MNQINVKPDPKLIEKQDKRTSNRRLDPPREEKKVEKKLGKGLTLRRLLGIRYFHRFERSHNTKKL